MPGDVLGTNLFKFQTNSFALTKGPIFTQLLLADEINRAPPKTQAALLQAMNERAVTIDGHDHALGEIHGGGDAEPDRAAGTYPLPEAQLDRFLFKIHIGYLSREEERDIVQRHGHRSAMPRLADFGFASGRRPRRAGAGPRVCGAHPSLAELSTTSSMSCAPPGACGP